MKQIIQNLKNGETSLLEVPSPSISDGSLLINTSVSLISPGTEKMLVDFGKASYFSKAKQQPEKVKQVIEKAKIDGISATYEAVQSKLTQPIALGYCNVGEVVGIGKGVHDFKMGDRVVSNGNHAEVVSVSKNLCAHIPDNVSNEQASFVVLSSIGLQGVRLAKPTLGEKFVVIGLGAIGLMTVQVLLAHGCKVLAIDLQNDRLKIASKFGALTVNPNEGEDNLSKADIFSNHNGVDGVIITASTKNHDVISQAAKMCRQRGRIILVGVTGLNLSRDDFYKKEISFQVSCSYGPGRYDHNYEEAGQDYPIGFVRWTEKRNFEAILDLMSSKIIDAVPLISHRIEFEEAPVFYKNMANGEQGLGILLNYSNNFKKNQSRTVSFQAKTPKINKTHLPAVIGFIGAGNYASRVLMPAFKKEGVELHTVVTSTGLSGSIHGKKHGFNYSSTDLESVMNNDLINTIVIATRHNSHSDLVCDALRAGKNVFVEKPLSITKSGLLSISKEYKNQVKSGMENSQLMVGFNRRFSVYTQKIKSLLSKVSEPKSFVMTMNAGYIPFDHWVQDVNSGGGRIIGETCHYIDLMRYLADSEITHVDARGMGKQNITKYNYDNASITLGFADGSFGTINYLANGSSTYPKEKIEIFTSGKVLALDNFRILRGYGWKNFKVMKNWQQEKGQGNCVKSFLDSIASGEPAIAFDELFEIASTSIDIDEIIRNQS
jgi:predicted dehydrogenase/threonine dehydrogenase-like Zn-dependent dehydrogenase